MIFSHHYNNNDFTLTGKKVPKFQNHINIRKRTENPIFNINGLGPINPIFGSCIDIRLQSRNLK